ncbi:hypothetical protein HYPSUDRAFT_200934 [Hypholoma sublateritium FD-334 SS-4]|uniref:Uncharacterized protein n=1 Tax=Hypholoma sublateritium (strain FD-334 SS-4) TaxID=945553 RepID=A0A0D2P641_HYPSF|nr:hypothetical protein HYPSUDRAFT_200934 [Hypholoma sublateritium FD-334 SS-4]
MSLGFLRTWFDRRDDPNSLKVMQLPIERDSKLNSPRFEFKKPVSRRRFLLNNGLASGTTPGFPVPSTDTRLSLTINPTFPAPITMEKNHPAVQYDIKLQRRDRRLRKAVFDWPSMIMTVAGDSALGFCVAFLLVLVTSSIFVAVATFWRDVNDPAAPSLRTSAQRCDNEAQPLGTLYDTHHAEACCGDAIDLSAGLRSKPQCQLAPTCPPPRHSSTAQPRARKRHAPAPTMPVIEVYTDPTIQISVNMVYRLVVCRHPRAPLAIKYVALREISGPAPAGGLYLIGAPFLAPFAPPSPRPALQRRREAPKNVTMADIAARGCGIVHRRHIAICRGRLCE